MLIANTILHAIKIIFNNLTIDYQRFSIALFVLSLRQYTFCIVKIGHQLLKIKWLLPNFN